MKKSYAPYQIEPAHNSARRRAMSQHHGADASNKSWVGKFQPGVGFFQPGTCRHESKAFSNKPWIGIFQSRTCASKAKALFHEAKVFFSNAYALRPARLLSMLILALLMAVPTTLRADVTLPTVSTDGNEVWYYIYLDTRSKFLQDNGTGTNATLAAFSYNSSAQLWKLTGDNTTGYTLTSKLGNTLYMTSTENNKSEIVYTAAMPAESYCSTFILKSTTSDTHTTSDYLLISPSTNTATYFNQYGGTKSENLGTYGNTTDVGSTFTFISAEEVNESAFVSSSTPFDEKWYYLSFTSNSGADYIRSQGDKTKIKTSTYTENDPKMLWKFVGDNTNGYTLTNNFTDGAENGLTLFFTSVAAYNESTASPVAYANHSPGTSGCSTFTFTPYYNYNSTPHGTFNTLAFAPTTDPSLYINRTATGSGAFINLWTTVDANSYIKATPREMPDLYIDTDKSPETRRVVWYDITLNSDETLYLTSSSTDDSEVTWETYNANNDAQRWCIMTNDDGTRTLVNRLGYTLYVKELASGNAFYAAATPSTTYTAYNVAQKVYTLSDSNKATDGYIIGTADDEGNYYFLSYATTTSTARKHSIGLKDDEATTTTTTTATVSTTVNDANTLLLLTKSTIPTVTATNTHYVNRVFDKTPATTYSGTTTAASTAESVEVDLTAYYDQLTTDLKADGTSVADNVYVRWRLEDSDGNDILIATDELTATATSSVLTANNEGALYWSGTAEEFVTNYEDLLNVTYAPADVETLYRVVCEITSGVTDVTSAPTAVTTKYIVRIIDDKDDAATYYQTNEISSPTEQTITRRLSTADESATSLTVNFATKLNTLRGSKKNEFFVRWYIADTDGNPIDGAQDGIAYNSAITDQYTQTDYRSYSTAGLIYYPRDNSASFKADNEFQPIVTLPDGYTWDQLQVIAIFTTDLTDWKTRYDLGDRKGVYDYWGIAGDPENITNKIVYKFKKAVATEKAPTTETTDKTHYFYKVYSSGSLALDVTSYYNQILTDLGVTEDELNEKGIYLRWHLETDGGYIMPTTEDELAAASTSTVMLRDADENLYWYSALGTTSAARAMKGTTVSLSDVTSDVLSVTYTPADATELYNVVCDVTYDPTTYGLALSSDGTSVTTVPNTIQSKYVFLMVDTKAEAAAYFTPNTDGIAAATKTDATVEVLSIANSATINRCYDDVNEARGSTSSSGFYVRWYLTDTNGNVLEDQSPLSYNDNVTNASATDGPIWRGAYFITDSYGICFYPRSNAASLSEGHSFFLKPKVTKPSGKDETWWSTVQLVTVITKAVTDTWKANSVIGDVFANYDNFGIAADPETIDAKIVYSFTTVEPTPNEFVHSTGYAYRYEAGGNDANFGSNGHGQKVQQVHSWSYNRYVRRGDTISLYVPVYKYETVGNDQEPTSYWRWYDYKTDRACSYLTTDSENGYALNRLSDGALWPMLQDQNGKSYGLFKWNIGDFPYRANVTGVVFHAPEDESWEGDSIACDVSRYNDYIDLTNKAYIESGTNAEGGTFTEPTLSLRYFFNVLPAKTCAEKIKAALLKNNARPVEDYGDITVGLLERNSGFIKLRLNLAKPDRYYFYPYSSSNYNVPATEDEFTTSSDDGSTVYPLQGKSLTWTIRTTINNELYYHVLGRSTESDQGASFVTDGTYELTMASIAGVYQKVSDNTVKQTISIDDIKEDKAYTVVVYLNAAESSTDADAALTTPLARFNCHFVKNSAPTLFSNISTHRTDASLRENYTVAGDITFDDFEGMDYSEPTAPFVEDEANVAKSNSWNTPLRWSLSNYSFVYPGLWHYKNADGTYTNYFDNTVSSWNAGMGISPFHGDYTLIKSMNYNNVSKSQTNYNGYRYYWFTGNTVFDCTHYDNNSKYGNFLFVDASDESRPIASVEFNANLCSGSALVASIAVADLTTKDDRNSSPQLMFKIYGYRTDANNNIIDKQLIHTFAAPDLRSTLETEDSEYTMGQWYQVYARAYIGDDVNVENYKKFLVTIDNYCKSTQGADYGIDNIRIYTRNNRVEVTQEIDASVQCDERANNAKLKLRTDHITLRSLLGMDKEGAPSGKPFYYRIVRVSDGAILGVDGKAARTASDEDYTEENSGKIVSKIATDGTKTYVNPDNFYYTVWYSSDAPEADSKEDGKPYLETDNEGIEYFVFADSLFALPVYSATNTSKYYISLSLPEATKAYDADGEEVITYSPSSDWGQPSKICSVYSAEFYNQPPTLVITNKNGTATTTFTAECGENFADLDAIAKLSIPNTLWGGTLTIPYKFDWIVTKNSVNSTDTKAKLTDDEQTKLVNAIKIFRSYFPDESYPDESYYSYTASTTDGEMGTSVNTDLPAVNLTNYPNYTEDVRNTLLKYIGDDKDIQLFLINSGELFAGIQFEEATSDMSLSLLLVTQAGSYTQEEDGQSYTYQICPTALTAELSLIHTGPQLMLGMPKVEYPDEWGNGAKYVRMGLEQLDKLIGGKSLRIPIYSYYDGNRTYSRNDNASTTIHSLQMENNGKLQLISTNDPTMLDNVGKYFGKVSETVDYAMTQTGSGLLVDFATYTTKDETTDANLSLSDFHEGYEYTFSMTYRDAKQISSNSLTICSGTTTFTIQIVPKYVTWTNRAEDNTNWNNDYNWRRSRAAELHKSTGTLDSNTDSFSDAEYSSASIPTQSSATGLLDYPDEEDLTGTKPTAYVPMKFTYVTIPSGVTSPNLNEYKMNESQGIISDLLNPALDPGTTNIEYYLMMKMKPSSDGIYDIERFYANTCKQIYFTTNAKLRNQHYLDYEKAWVDFSTTTNQWTLWSTPLQNVYAGDMYVPKASGQQTTEAFQSIGFKDAIKDANGNDTRLYSRATYPVYQRSWNNAEPLVITTDNDSRGEDKNGYSAYDATVNYDDVTEVKTYLMQWSHDYNDTTVPYVTGHGFAIKAGNPTTSSSTNGTTTTVFRLPKADESYTYYTYKDEDTKESYNASTIARDSTGVLAISNRYMPQSSRNGIIEIPISDIEQKGGYYLVGNPYMASLDMAKFFIDAYNPQFYSKYWVLKDGVMTGYGALENNNELGYVEPMSAFFIKLKDNETVPSKVMFSPAMTAANFYGTGSVEATTKVGLTARAGMSTARATVIVSSRADNDFRDEEDVETLFDSNLEGKPAVYTVAGQMTTQINRMADLTNVPLGFRYSGTEPLTFFVTGVDRLSKPVYLRDAVAGTCTALADSMEVSVEPNAVGRYFLTSEATPQRAIQTALRCYSLEAGKVVAATSEGDRLTEIAVYDTAARLQRAWSPNVTSCTFPLSRGIYLITLTSDAVPEGRTFKVLVK